MEHGSLQQGPIVKAPAGRLGVVFKQAAQGHVVHLVRDESPVSNQLQPGDVVMMVGDVDTSEYNHAQMVQLLSSTADRERVLTLRARSGQ